MSRSGIGRVVTGSSRIFLVEHYWPGSTAEEFADAMGRVEAAVADMAADGTPIGFLHSTFVPGDEGGLSVVSAASEVAVRTAYQAVGVRFDRIVEAVEPDPRPPTAEAE